MKHGDTERSEVRSLPARMPVIINTPPEAGVHQFASWRLSTNERRHLVGIDVRRLSAGSGEKTKESRAGLRPAPTNY